jgi:hypothetical protein
MVTPGTDNTSEFSDHLRRYMHCFPGSSRGRPRRWSVVVHQHEDASVTARVWVDGKLLLPDCVGCSGAGALAYVEEALIDVRPGDALELRAQGSGGIRTFRPPDPTVASRWLAYRLDADAEASAPLEAVGSGTRPIVREDATRCPRGGAVKIAS